MVRVLLFFVVLILAVVLGRRVDSIQDVTSRQLKHLERYERLLESSDSVDKENKNKLRSALQDHRGKIADAQLSHSPHEDTINSLETDFEHMRADLRSEIAGGSSSKRKDSRSSRKGETRGLTIDFEKDIVLNQGRSQNLTPEALEALRERVVRHNREAREVESLVERKRKMLEKNEKLPSSEENGLRQLRREVGGEKKRILHTLDLPVRYSRATTAGHKMVDAAHSGGMPARELEQLKKDIVAELTNLKAITNEQQRMLDNDSSEGDSWDSAEGDVDVETKKDDLMQRHMAHKKAWKRLVGRTQKYARKKEL